MVRSKKISTIDKAIIWVCAVSVLLLTIGVFMFLYKGNTGPILAVANKFQPNDSWELNDEQITAPAIFCLYTCPEVTRQWSRSYRIGNDEFLKYISLAGWHISTKLPCESNTDEPNLMKCNASSTDGRYKVKIESGPSSSDGYKIWIRVDEVQ